MKKLFLVILLCLIKSTLFAQTIQSVYPNYGYTGDNELQVTISGMNTNFSQGSSTITFSQGSSTYFTGYNTQIQSVTQLTTYIDIPCTTDTGLYDLSVTNNGTTVSAVNAFTVHSATIESVTPDSASEGDILSVQISGLNTNFSQGSSTYIQFEQGTSTYFTGYNTLVNTPTQLSTSISISCSASPGLYNLLIEESNGCLLTQDSAFKVILSPCNDFNVWPGDANEDLVVNNYDLIPIGLYYGDTGTARVSGSNTWASQPATNWDSLQADGFNRKFVDCNGDGKINSDDTLAITQNYGLTHLFDSPRSSPERTSGTVPLSIVTDSSSYHAGSAVHATVSLGNSTNPATNLYGLAYDISLNTSIIEPGSIVFNYNNASFLGTKNANALVIIKQNDDVETAVIGFDHINKSGSGKIADLYFTLTNSSNSSQLGLSIISYEAVDAQGNQITLLTGISQLSTNNEQLSVYPNPSSGQFIIKLPHNQNEYLAEVYNVMGEKIYQSVLSNSQNFINISAQPDGMYFIYLKSDEGVEVGKVLVTK
jgi:hypothetical protein